VPLKKIMSVLNHVNFLYVFNKVYLNHQNQLLFYM